MKFELNYDKGELIESSNNEELLEILSVNKSKIDNISAHWNSVKKRIHEYEFLYTSPNRRKNISNILPISRSYFKLKEILKDYDIKIDNYVVFSMAEAPGGFIQELLENNINKIYANTLKIYDPSVPKWNINLLNNKKINFYYGIKEDGDLTDINNLLSYIKYIGKSSVDLVTGDGGFDYSNDYNKQEQNSLPLIYSEILLALNILKPGGIFICKIFDFFLKETINLIYLLTLVFKKVYIHKPKFSRSSNSEKYLVCLDYKGYNKNINNRLFRYHKNSKMMIKINSNFNNKINEFTSEYISKQIEQINKGVEIINSKKKDKIPSQLQIDKAVEWCHQYGIEVNKECYYISGHSPHDNFAIESE
jgi:23S rRNA U2552 (ribose-2'-O)-methylase RlmE/FtsJ